MLITKIRNSSFIFNILTLMSGTAVAQVILFAATPLLTRLYNPDEFGIFAIYLAVVTTIGSIASLKYEMAIILPKDDQDAQSIFFLSTLITLLLSIFISLLILFLKSYITNYFSTKIVSFIWIVPLGILATGMVQNFVAFSIRGKYYKNVSASRIGQASITVVAQISSKSFNLFPMGLIWGNLLGTVSACMYFLTYHLKRNTLQLKNFNRERLLKNAKQFKNFPKYQSFAVFQNSFSQNLPAILLAYFYSPEIAGFYALTRRLFTAPTQLIGQSTREVYYQKAARMYANGERIDILYIKTTLGLAKTAFVPFIIIGIFAQPLFMLIFGKEWVTSGIYAQIIIFWAFLAFINPPTTATLNILNLQKFGLKYETLLTIFRVISIYIGYALFKQHYASIILFSLTGFIFNVYYIWYIYKKAKTDA